MKDDNSSNWSEEAKATFTLCSHSSVANLNDATSNDFEKHLTPKIFNNLDHEFGIEKFIDWHSLFDSTKMYVNYGKITLKIKIVFIESIEKIESNIVLETVDKCCDDAGIASFRLFVLNLKNLDSVRTSSFKFRSGSWYFVVSRNEMNHLSVCLQSNSLQTYEMEMDIKLISSDDEKSIQQSATKQIKDGQSFFMDSIVPWDMLLNVENGFIKNKSAIIEIELFAKKPKNANPNIIDNNANYILIECAICIQSIIHQEVSYTPCGHLFCSTCIQNAVTQCEKCPLCNSPIKLGQVKRMFLPM